MLKAQPSERFLERSTPGVNWFWGFLSFVLVEKGGSAARSSIPGDVCDGNASRDVPRHKTPIGEYIDMDVLCRLSHDFLGPIGEPAICLYTDSSTKVVTLFLWGVSTVVGDGVFVPRKMNVGTPIRRQG